MTCTYDEPIYTPEEGSPNTVTTPVQHLLPSIDFTSTGTLDLPESESRRLLEMRLLHHYILHTSPTFPASHNACVREAWTVEAPKLAIQNATVQYGMFATTALHLAKSTPEDPELIAAHLKYLGLALREQRRAVAQLNIYSADAVCFTSVLITIIALASLEGRPLEPYTAPMQWLEMASGSLNILSTSIMSIKDDPSAKIMMIVKGVPDLSDNNELYNAQNRADFSEILSRDRGSEDWDEEVQEAYEKTLSYIGSIKRAISNGEHTMAILRRVFAFAMHIPRRFIKLVQEQRPRALVVLAHYFALATKPGYVWYIGDVPHREVVGIQKALPDEWRDQMRWPLAMVGLTSL